MNMRRSVKAVRMLKSLLSLNFSKSYWIQLTVTQGRSYCLECFQNYEEVAQT